MHTQKFIEEMKQILLRRKQELETELDGLHSHTEIGDEMDENATEVYVDEANQDMIARIKLDLEKIETALTHIELGTYGLDAEGNEISEERLRVLPWADTNA